MKKLLITVCGRAGSKGFKNKNLKTFCGKPLVYYSLAAAGLFLAAHPEVKADIALNTDSADLAKLVADKYPEVTFLPRCEELGGDTVPKMAVIQDSLTRMEEKNGCKYDYVMDLDITSPLRTAEDLACQRLVHRPPAGPGVLRRERQHLRVPAGFSGQQRHPQHLGRQDLCDPDDGHRRAGH